MNVRAVTLCLFERKYVNSLGMPYCLDFGEWVVGCDDLERCIYAWPHDFNSGPAVFRQFWQLWYQQMWSTHIVSSSNTSVEIVR
jgi:hypothetical protein